MSQLSALGLFPLAGVMKIPCSICWLAGLKALDDTGMGKKTVDAVYVANMGGGSIQLRGNGRGKEEERKPENTRTGFINHMAKADKWLLIGSKTE